MKIIGLAIIAYNGKCNEGYDNTNTMYSEYMKRIEPTIRAINYFSGKSVRVCAKSGDFSQIWITDEYKRTTYTQMDVYDGSKIPSEMAARLEKKLLEGFKTGETKQTFDDDINQLISEVVTELKNQVGSDVYDSNLSRIDLSDIVATDKLPFLAKVVFLKSLGDIGDEKMIELYNKIWDSSTLISDIEKSINDLNIPNYDLKMRVYNEVAYFNAEQDLTDADVAKIYASIKTNSTIENLYKVINDYLSIIPSYDEKVKNMETRVTTNKLYNADLPDVVYHESAEKLEDKTDTDVMVKDASGNLVKLLWDKTVTTTPRYNEPSYFRYNPSPYVPSYEDSVYLSRTTKYDDNDTQIVDYGFGLPPSAAGFCYANKNNSIALEKECGKIDKNACASTSCCVLLGGSKCVAGDKSGPTMKSNYSDISVLNKDYYYYQGNCYGNCPP